MAIVLSTTGGSQAAPSRFRQWISKIAVLAGVTGCSVSSASPLVVTKTAHGFANGDIVNGTGIANNLAAAGANQVFYVSANTFKLVPVGSALIAGNAVNGSAGSADAAAVFARLYVGVKPHDLLNMHSTLSRVSYTKDSDAADPTYTEESTIVSIFGTSTL